MKTIKNVQRAAFTGIILAVGSIASDSFAEDLAWSGTASIAGTVEASSLTTSGAVTATGTDVTAHSGYVPNTAPSLVLPGLKLSDITALSAHMGGKGISSLGETLPAIGCHFAYSGTSGSVQFQSKKSSTRIACVKVALTEKPDGVHAVSTMAYYVDRVDIGADVDHTPVQDTHVYTVAGSGTDAGYGICDMTASTSRIRLSGAATLGGALTLTNVAFDVVAPVSQTFDRSISMKNGTLTVAGESTETTDKTFGIIDSSVSGEAAAWLTETASDTVFTNMVLSRTIPVSAVMRGTAITSDANASPYNVTFDEKTQTRTVQYQIYEGGIKACLVEYRQDGSDVTARWVKGYYLSAENGGTIDALGVDLAAEQANGNTNVRNYGVKNYGVKSIVLRTVDVPSLTLAASNTIPDMTVDNAQVFFDSETAQPQFLIATNAAQVAYLKGTRDSGDGYVRLFTAKSAFLCKCDQAESRAHFIFDDSTLNLSSFSYFNELTLRNGASVIGSAHMRSGYYNATNESHVVSAGAAGCAIAADIQMLYHRQSGLTNTLYFVTEADLLVSGRISDAQNSAYKGSSIVKQGDAKLTLSGTNTFEGRLTVESGTLELGSNGALPDAAPLTLSSGTTVVCGAMANTTGALTLAGDAKIELGDGALVFADSSGENWASGATLTITGNGDLPNPRTIRFGTDANGLTPGQLKRIRYNGSRVTLDDQGYIRGPRGLMVIVR